MGIHALHVAPEVGANTPSEPLGLRASPVAMMRWRRRATCLWKACPRKVMRHRSMSSRSTEVPESMTDWCFPAKSGAGYGQRILLFGVPA
jgi:hypothetical protein